MTIEKLNNDSFSGNKAQENGLPTVALCAENLHLSSNYFGDLIKKETGQSPQEYIHAKVIDPAKEKIFNYEKSLSEIVYELGLYFTFLKLKAQVSSYKCLVGFNHSLWRKFQITGYLNAKQNLHIIFGQTGTFRSLSNFYLHFNLYTVLNADNLLMGLRQGLMYMNLFLLAYQKFKH